MQPFHKTRLAPTPSGFLHLGNAFSFILTAAIASKHGASILLRIDDLDRSRVKREYLADIFDTLTFLDIDWDEGPRTVNETLKSYSQHRRLALYKESISELNAKGFLFPCACSRKDLASAGLLGGCTGRCQTKEEPFALKLKECPERLAIHLYASGISYLPYPKSTSQFIVQKKDGLPSYHLASVVDDIHFGVDLVVRGKDLWDSSLAQVYLASLTHGLQPYTATTFFHHSLVTENGAKLSKSAGHTSIQHLRKKGLSKEAMYQQAGAFFGLQEKVSNLQEFTQVVHPMRIIGTE
ncbi:MAG: tRNA glutamyl-Q synthetase [Lunatimonas sp.]|uniref:glutamate--tRNA ligase family protein n=1 Tax=Lunatimonas sp. TaxID=2060141 RepID=UPI00263AB7E2|nr:glutamate--tRNA ligase family protein [Lunatimonas sp.]MCC5937186.1 tRNA glutamyl-Q synthetase [Lunatimonas sp.]